MGKKKNNKPSPPKGNTLVVPAASTGKKSKKERSGSFVRNSEVYDNASSAPSASPAANSRAVSASPVPSEFG